MMTTIERNNKIRTITAILEQKHLPYHFDASRMTIHDDAGRNITNYLLAVLIAKDEEIEQLRQKQQEA